MGKAVLVGLVVLLAVGAGVCDEKEWLKAYDKAFENQDYTEAIEQAEECVNEYPKSHMCWHRLGWAYLKGDRVTKAEKAFNKALRIKSDLDNAYVGKGAIQRKRGRIAKAREYYLKAIEINPENPEAYSSLVVLELMEGNYAKAKKYGEAAWQLRQDYALIPANLSIAYHYSGEVKKRDEFYDKAKKLGYENLDGLKEIFSGRKTLKQ